MTDEPKPDAKEPQADAGDAEPDIYELEPVDESAGSPGETPVPPADASVSPVDVPEPAGETPVPPVSVAEPSADTPPPATAMAKTPDAPFTQGLGGIRTAMITSAVLILLALIMTGVRAGDTELAALMLTLAGSFLTILVNGALGTLAVIAAARCVGTRVAEPELFALRMLAAAAAFAMLYETGAGIPSRIDDFLLGVAGYATIVWLFFRLPPKETGLVIVWHGGFVALLALNTWVGSPTTEPTDTGNQQPAASEPVRDTIPSID